MLPARKHPHALFLLAFLSVAALMLLSDFSPRLADDLGSIKEDERTEVTCLVVNSRTSEKGFLLSLTDANGNSAEAFCPFDIADAPPDGSLVRLIVEPSSEDPGFLFIKQLEVVQGPSGKD